MARTLSIVIAAGMLVAAAAFMLTAREPSLFLERAAPAEQAVASAAVPAA